MDKQWNCLKTQTATPAAFDLVLLDNLQPEWLRIFVD